MTSYVDETLLHKVVNLDEDEYPMLWTEGYQDSAGHPCTTLALAISPSSDEEIAASDGDNASKIICDQIGLDYEGKKNARPIIRRQHHDSGHS